MSMIVPREELARAISSAAKSAVMFGVYHKVVDEVSRRYLVRFLGELSYPAVSLGSAAAFYAISRIDRVPEGAREFSAIASGVGVGLTGVGLVRYLVDDEPLCWFVAGNQIRCMNIDASKREEIRYLAINGQPVSQDGILDYKGGSGNFTITLKESFGPGGHHLVVVGIRKAFSGLAYL